MKFRVIVSDVDEDEISYDNLTNGLIIKTRKKGESVAELNREALIISADTVVVLDKHIMGKPTDEDEARVMLEKLSGQSHQVKTAFGLIFKKYNKSYFEMVTTTVKFRSLNDEEITAYVNTGEPLDKAGGYAIQGRGAILIESIEGCYFNVVGFPLTNFYIALRDFCRQIKF
jgi:septum formation protein